MSPDSSSVRTRRRQADSDRLTRSASELLAMRPSCCSACTMALSKRSSFMAQESTGNGQNDGRFCHKPAVLGRMAHLSAHPALLKYCALTPHPLARLRMRIGVPKE